MRAFLAATLALLGVTFLTGCGGKASSAAGPAPEAGLTDASVSDTTPGKTDGCSSMPPGGGACEWAELGKTCVYTNGCPNTLVSATCRTTSKGVAWVQTEVTPCPGDAGAPDALRPDGCPASTGSDSVLCSELGKRCVYDEACPKYRLELTCSTFADGSVRWKSSEQDCPK